jgi:hypothetical protein
MTTDNFFLQNRQNQTSQTGGQEYMDTSSPFSIPCMSALAYCAKLNYAAKKSFYSISLKIQTIGSVRLRQKDKAVPRSTTQFQVCVNSRILKANKTKLFYSFTNLKFRTAVPAQPLPQLNAKR